MDRAHEGRHTNGGDDRAVTVSETLNRGGVAAIGLAVCGDVAKPSIGTLQRLAGISVEQMKHADSPAQTGSRDGT